MIKFSDRLKQLRKEKEMSQEELGKIFGTGKAAICNYEKNVRIPPADKIAEYANYFNVSIDYILGKSETRNPEKPDAYEIIIEKAKSFQITPERLEQLIDLLAKR